MDADSPQRLARYAQRLPYEGRSHNKRSQKKMRTGYRRLVTRKAKRVSMCNRSARFPSAGSGYVREWQRSRVAVGGDGQVRTVTEKEADISTGSSPGGFWGSLGNSCYSMARNVESSFSAMHG